MRGWLVRVACGAALGAFGVAFAEATEPYRSFGCAGDVDSPPCGAGPGLWSWSTVTPALVVAGAVAGALIAFGLGRLAGRVRRKRRLWGEL